MKRVFKAVVALFSVMLLTCAVAFASPELPVKHGMRGESVEIVQRLLAKSGVYSGSIDGVFGNGTLQAVREFQVKYGLEPDGIVGQETFRYLNRSDSEGSRYSRSLTMSASAYTAYDDGNSHYTYRGNLVRKGLVAVDPSVIPLGTRLYIPGYGYAIADDIGGAIKGNRIDLAFESRSEALKFGRQTITVHVVE
ncbi:3D domain-containing protein [Dendrosporobacter sp. 1207_IL3150]|uniref:3D domain-containing protein n=1 Tax=Dendrosporobacter sp. 1207_IL3150 TaxID=3084054 RepID=UPI002FDAF285